MQIIKQDFAKDAHQIVINAAILGSVMHAQPDML